MINKLFQKENKRGRGTIIKLFQREEKRETIIKLFQRGKKREMIIKLFQWECALIIK